MATTVQTQPTCVDRNYLVKYSLLTSAPVVSNRTSETIEQQAGTNDAEVASGVYRFGTERVNWDVVEMDRELIVVDAGLPSHWQLILNDLEYSLDDISAVVLTHGHGDHIAFGEHLRETAEVPILVHEADMALVESTAERYIGELVRYLWRPAIIRLLVEFNRGDGVPSRVRTVKIFKDGSILDVPGDPQVIHVPGHSDGSCALHLSDHKVLLCADALATLDIKTGHRNGPQIMSIFNTDRQQAVESLDWIEPLAQVTLMPNHDDPWHGEMHKAVRLAQRWE